MTIKENSFRTALILKFLIGILLITTSAVYAQKNQAYKQGYVILLNGDSIPGSVMDRDESAFGGLLAKVKFRSDKGRRKKYKPSDLLGYKRGSDVFESIWISVETKSFKQIYSSKQGLGEQQFVKVVYRGSINLYHWEYTDAENSHIDFIPLIRKTNSELMVRATQGILGLKRKRLAEYFADCPNLVVALKNKTLNSTNDLIDYYETNCLQ